MTKIPLLSFLVFIVFAGLAQPVSLHCWIVQRDDGVQRISLESISNQVTSANKIFSQVAMSFEISSINYTNDSRYVSVSFTNDVLQTEICNITNATNGVEIYFVESVTDGALAFRRSDGIIIGTQGYGETLLAHELGHACGLADIYDYNSQTTLRVQGLPQASRFTHDWGWYPDGLTQPQIIQKLLMYGYNTPYGTDMPRGDIYGVWYEYVPNSSGLGYNKVWHLSNAPVGFKLHGNRHPVSQ